MTPIEIGTALGTAVVLIIIGIDKWKEHRAKKKGLSANPTRCGEHAVKLGIIETEITNIKADIAEIKKKIG